MAKAAEKRTGTVKRGRPSKPAAERKRHNQTFRITDARKAELEFHADANQKSVSEEIEYRLARYEDLDEVFSAMFRDRSAYDLFDALINDRAALKFFALQAKVMREVREEAQRENLSPDEMAGAFRNAIYACAETFDDKSEMTVAPRDFLENTVHGKQRSPAAIGWEVADQIIQARDVLVDLPLDQPRHMSSKAR